MHHFGTAGWKRVFASGLAAILLTEWAPRSPAQDAAGISLRITVREGDGALNNIRTGRAKEPVVVVTDGADRPVAGAVVAFLLPELGASASFPTGTAMTVTTGDDGVAVGRSMKPNNAAGPFEIRVVASHQGQTARAVIRQTNALPKASSGGGGGRKTAMLVAVIGGAGAALAVGVTRGKANPAAAPGASISAGGTTFGPPQ